MAPHHRPIRLVGIGLIIGLGAWPAGARATVNAVRNASTLPPAQPEPPLDATENENIAYPREASPAISRERFRHAHRPVPDFSTILFPVEGADSADR